MTTGRMMKHTRSGCAKETLRATRTKSHFKGEPMNQHPTQPPPKKCRFCGAEILQRPTCDDCEEKENTFWRDSIEIEETYTDFSKEHYVNFPNRPDSLH